MAYCYLMKAAHEKTIDLGNSESITRGVFRTPDGWLAMTFTKSKPFKTFAGAERWFKKNTGEAS